MHIGNKAIHTSSNAYQDMEGNQRNFTHIDYDKKTKKALLAKGESKEELASKLTDYRKVLVKRILELPASHRPMIFVDFTLQGDTNTSILWNKEMLLDEGLPISQLRDLYTLTSNFSRRL